MAANLHRLSVDVAVRLAPGEDLMGKGIIDELDRSDSHRRVLTVRVPSIGTRAPIV